MATPKLPKMKLRYITGASGVRYLRLEDVAAYIRELAGGEETDVRNRLHEAARNLEKTS